MQPEFTLKGNVHSDFVGNLNKSKSTIGYVLTPARGAAILMSKLLTVVALSTTEVQIHDGYRSLQENNLHSIVFEEAGSQARENYYVL